MQISKTSFALSDFDFWVGIWKARHCRLRERLVGCDEWIEFGGTSEVRKILDGSGIIEDNLLDLPGAPYKAASLKIFDPETQNWIIWWVDGRYPERADPPVVGGFADGVGIFHADDVFNGEPIRVRFIWSHITPRSCRWEQAFSADAGRSWETNWTMQFERVE